MSAVKQGVAWGVTTSAECAHQAYETGAGVAQEYPEIVNYSNIVVDAADSAARQAIDTNLNTATWSDLGAMWLFEVGPSKLEFGPDATTTKDVMHQQGIHEARTLAVAKIANYDFSPDDKCLPLNQHLVCHDWVYGQDAFYSGLREGNTATSFLGSYTTNVDAQGNEDNSYTLSYRVYNVSGRESASRLRRAAYPGGPHQGIFPDVDRGAGIHLGGTVEEDWRWTERVSLIMNRK